MKNTARLTSVLAASLLCTLTVTAAAAPALPKPRFLTQGEDETPVSAVSARPRAGVHSIVIEAGAGGSVSVSHAEAAEGQTVIVTVKPEAGSALYSLSAEADDRELSLIDLGGGVLLFTMPAAGVKVRAIFGCDGKKGCPIGAYAGILAHGGAVSDALHEWAQDGEIPQPEKILTRAEYVTMLWQMGGRMQANMMMPFTDVKEGTAACEAIRWAAAKEIVTGTDEKTFEPDAPLTREDAVRMLFRYAQQYGEGFHGAWMFLLPFDDIADIGDGAYTPFCWCVMKHIVEMPGRTLAPQTPITASEGFGMLEKMMQVLEGK